MSVPIAAMRKRSSGKVAQQVKDMSNKFPSIVIKND